VGKGYRIWISQKMQKRKVLEELVPLYILNTGNSLILEMVSIKLARKQWEYLRGNKER